MAEAAAPSRLQRDLINRDVKRTKKSQAPNSKQKSFRKAFSLSDLRHLTSDLSVVCHLRLNSSQLISSAAKKPCYFFLACQASRIGLATYTDE